MADKGNGGVGVIFLPSDGGALKGLGEKFSPDLFTPFAFETGVSI